MFGKKKEEDIYSVVVTTKAKYFGIVARNDKGITIESAYEIQTETEAKEMARHYMKSKLYGDNKRVELTDALVESIAECPDATRIIKTYEALLPQAKERAMGIMTYKALDDLLPK